MFYRVHLASGRKKKFAYGVFLEDWPSIDINCISCGRQWKKDTINEEDTKLRIALSNNYYPSFVNLILHQLVEENAFKVLTQENTIGFHCAEIKIIALKDITEKEKKQLRFDGFKVKDFAIEPPKYYRLFIDGKAELHEKSEVIMDENCIVCGYMHYITVGKTSVDSEHPRFIVKDSWDGSDLFIVKEFPAVIYCTEKFVEIFNKYKLTGLEFEKVECI